MIVCADSIHVSVTEGLWQLKGLVNLLLKLASNERNRMAKVPSKIQNGYRVMKVLKLI